MPFYFGKQQISQVQVLSALSITNTHIRTVSMLLVVNFQTAFHTCFVLNLIYLGLILTVYAKKHYITAAILLF
jgi:hypothetical protein